MRASLFLATGLLLAGCGGQEQTQREVLAKLDALKSDLAAKHPAPVRWAFADKRQIDSAIFQWSRNKLEEVRKSEGLPAETEEKIRQYESLQFELMRKRSESMRPLMPPRSGAWEAPVPDPEYVALSNRLAQAKVPIADIVDRRSRLASQLRDEFSADKLVAEYAKDRFDLVVDSSDLSFSRSAVLYRASGEVLDITEGVIKLFQEQAKQQKAKP